MVRNKHIFSVVLLLLLIPISVSIVAYQFVKLPSSVTSAQAPVINPLARISGAQPQIQTARFDAVTVEKYLTVEAALLGADDHMSLYMKDEGLDKDISINSVRSWIPASTIKSFVAIEAFRQRDNGIINFDNAVTISPKNVVPTELETDEFPRLREGTQVAIRQLIEAMIIQSDNTAYNTLLDILDRRNINATLRNWGITQTVAGEKINLDDGQFQADLQVPGRQPNTITAKDLATLFDLLYVGKIAHSDEILAIFKRQKINTMIPALLPPGVVVAHKTGDWSPIYHDGGIIYKSNDPFILSILTDANDPNVLAQLARVAYYRTSQVVGEGIKTPFTPQADENSGIDRIYLAEAPQSTNVLGTETDTLSGERIYTVQPGDTLWSIATIQYGSPYVYPAIVSRNAVTNSGSISPGMNLYLPPIPGTTFVPENQNPTLNNADLGVTADDLKISQAQTRTVGNAFILPGSPLYLLKEWFSNGAVQLASTKDAKIDALLAISASKLAEVKRELKIGNVNAIQSLLVESEDALRQATNIAKSSTNNDIALFKIKQQRDLHFGLLAEAAPNVTSAQKNTYVNAVYTFYTKQKQDVQPAVASLSPTNPLQQKPVVGTVSDIKNNIATIHTDEGKTVQVLLTALTPARRYNGTSVETATSIHAGEKLAVVGALTQESIVTAQFILRDVPKQLPAGHRGTVLEINPKEHTMTIQDTQGKIDTIMVSDTTTIKSKDTNVSIVGIKAGSTITIVGTVVPVKIKGTPVTTITPTTSEFPAPTKTPIQGLEGKAQPPGQPAASKGVPSGGKPGISIGGAPTQKEKIEQTTPVTITKGTSGTVGQTVRANTVTVEKNSSGKNEKVTTSVKTSPVESKPSGESQKSSAGDKPSSQSQPPARPPKPVETKSEDKKK